jgi:hypothetical protein
MGFKGSWFCSWVMRRFRKSLSPRFVEPEVLDVPVVLVVPVVPDVPVVL